MAKVKVTTIKFADEELALLDLIQGQTGIRSRAEALRTVLKHYIQTEGLDETPPAQGPKPR
jgi:metal-responsive CopG/Arc/MetJ family transcriptional regulator